MNAARLRRCLPSVETFLLRGRLAVKLTFVASLLQPLGCHHARGWTVWHLLLVVGAVAALLFDGLLRLAMEPPPPPGIRRSLRDLFLRVCPPNSQLTNDQDPSAGP